MGILVRALSRPVSIHRLQPVFRTLIDDMDVGKVNCEGLSRRELFKRITRLIAYMPGARLELLSFSSEAMMQLTHAASQPGGEIRTIPPRARVRMPAIWCKLVHSGVHLYHGIR